VETGWRLGGRVEIVKGLMEGERVVAAANFLLDSESRMRAVSAGIFQAETDPVCGMEVDGKKASAAGRTAAHGGRTYYFCADECKRKFEAEPAKYLAAGHDHAAVAGPATVKAATSAPAAEPATAKDLVCGMDIDPKKAAAAGLKSDYKGKTYYFCAEDCKKQFDAEPGKFIGR
jgi:Cu+-exporting ATPase